MLYFYGLSMAKMCRCRQIYAYLFLKNFKIRCKVLEMMSDIICVRKKMQHFLEKCCKLNKHGNSLNQVHGGIQNA